MGVQVQKKGRVDFVWFTCPSIYYPLLHGVCKTQYLFSVLFSMCSEHIDCCIVHVCTILCKYMCIHELVVCVCVCVCVCCGRKRIVCLLRCVHLLIVVMCMHVYISPFTLSGPHNTETIMMNKDTSRGTKT